jgi:hypothetical protein
MLFVLNDAALSVQASGNLQIDRQIIFFGCETSASILL